MQETERAASVAQVTDGLQVVPVAIGHDMANDHSIATDLQSYPLRWVGRIKRPAPNRIRSQ